MADSTDYENYMTVIENCEALGFTTMEICEKFDERASKISRAMDDFAQGFGYGMTQSLIEQAEGLFSAAGEFLSNLHRKHKIKKAKNLIREKATETKEQIEDIIPNAIACFQHGMESTKDFAKRVSDGILLPYYNLKDHESRDTCVTYIRALIGDYFAYSYGVELGNKILKYFKEYEYVLNNSEDLYDFNDWYEREIKIDKVYYYKNAYIAIQDSLLEGLDKNGRNTILNILGDLDGTVPVFVNSPGTLLNNMNADLYEYNSRARANRYKPSFYYENDNYKATLDLCNTVYNELLKSKVKKSSIVRLVLPSTLITVAQVVVFLVLHKGFNPWITFGTLGLSLVLFGILYGKYVKNYKSHIINHALETAEGHYLYDELMTAIVDNERHTISAEDKKGILDIINGVDETEGEEEKTSEESSDDLLAQIAATGTIEE